MSKVAIQGNASGTGTFTIAAPNSNTDRTLVLPDEAGTVLTSASSIPASQLPSNTVMTSGTAIDMNGQSSAEFTGIPSGTKLIILSLHNLVTDYSANVAFELGDSGGMESSGYESVLAYNYDGSNLSNSRETTQFRLGGWGTRVYGGTLTLTLVDSASNTWSGVATSTTNSSSERGILWSVGTKSLSSTLDRLRFLTSTGTCASGTVNILYI